MEIASPPLEPNTECRSSKFQMVREKKIFGSPVPDRLLSIIMLTEPQKGFYYKDKQKPSELLIEFRVIQVLPGMSLSTLVPNFYKLLNIQLTLYVAIVFLKAANLILTLNIFDSRGISCSWK